ncbi:unnamed protein product [Symbiodinium sp. CCMP2592]|nr:unnamed protein product [Symbiodinium sp. CCMP2592]
MSWPTRWRLLCLLSVLVAPAWAWSGTGHLHVAMVAQKVLTESNRLQVRDLLHGDLVDFAHYEQKLHAQAAAPNSAACQFHSQTPEWKCQDGIGINGQVHCDGSESSHFSLLCALAYTFEKFAHDMLLVEFPKTDFIRMASGKVERFWTDLKANPELSGYAEMLTSPEDELRWLAIFLGDMHQPLHWLRGEHDYGRNLTVIHNGKEQSLYDFWEQELPLLFHMHNFQAAASRLKREQKLEPFNVHPSDVFAEWGRELSALACREIYGLPELAGASGAALRLNEEILQRWRALYEDLVLKAGFRLARTMRELLTHRKHAAGQQHGRGLHRPRRHAARHFAKNAVIAVPTVAALLLFFRFDFRGGVLALQKHLKT